MVTANLFCLQNLIWRTIEGACCLAALENGKKNKVIISFGIDPTRPSIWFSMGRVDPDKIENTIKGWVESEEDQSRSAYLGVTIQKNKENNGFGLLWTQSS
jgi:hypothetical protein